MTPLETAFERDRALSNELLDDVVRSTYLYAVRLGALSRFRTSRGDVVDVRDTLSGYRVWLEEAMLRLSTKGWAFGGDEAHAGVGTRAWCGNWHRAELQTFWPTLVAKLRETVSHVEVCHAGVDVAELEAVLGRKALGLALGGGGGTGFVHQALFQCLETHGIRPSIITGTSIGGLMGLIRAMRSNYDAASTILRMPSWWRLTKHLRPCGHTRYGQPALCRFDFGELIRGMTREFGYTTPPRFSSLPIPFACVSSGIIRDPHVIESFEALPMGMLTSILNFTRLSWKHVCDHAVHMAKMLMSSNAVRPVVLGFDALTQGLSVEDAVGFSALVPGVLNYEVPQNHYRNREILDAVFSRDGLYRLVDGGLTSNVPVRTLNAELENMRLGHTNVYVLGVDVFAPQLNDGLFYPLEQIANANADQDARASSAFLRLKNLLSPMNLSPTLNQYKWLNEHFSDEFHEALKVIQYVMTPLCPLSRVLAGMTS